jgi:hypothetical protein
MRPTRLNLARLNWANSEVGRFGGCLMLCRKIARFAAARDQTLSHGCANTERQKNPGGENKSCQGSHDGIPFGRGPLDLFGWARFDRASTSSTLQIEPLAFRDYSETWQLAFAPGDGMPGSASRAFCFPGKIRCFVSSDRRVPTGRETGPQ